MNKDNPCTTQLLTDVLSDISLYLQAAERFSLDHDQGGQIADIIVNYCADYAKTTANRVNQDEAQ